jgi:hypothetical protein
MRASNLTFPLVSILSTLALLGCSAKGQEASSAALSAFCASPPPSPQAPPREPLAALNDGLPSMEEPILFDTAEADHFLDEMAVFPPNNPWNQDVSDLPTHPASEAIIASIGESDSLSFSLDMNFILVPPTQPEVPVAVNLYPDESDPGPFPIPAEAPIEHWPITVSGDRSSPWQGETLEQFQRSGEGDRHLIVVDPQRGRLHEFWQARKTDTGWQASQASTWDLNGNARRPEGWTSADAAGLPIFPAVVRYHEVASGMVQHAMRFTVRRTQSAYVCPANHSVGDDHDPSLPRMGERLRLRGDFDTSSFPPHARAILEGLKRYGMFLADRGHNWSVSISPDQRFEGLESLSKVQGRDLEVVDTTGS